MQNVLLKMNQGLGDAVMHNIIIKHVKKYNPDWDISVETGLGKESCHTHLVKQVFIKDRGGAHNNFDKIININFPDPDNNTSKMCIEHDVPPSKVTKALIDELHIKPIKSLYYYEMHIPENVRRIAKNYVNSLPINKGLIIIHYQASSNPHNKNIDGRDTRKICDSLVNNGYTPLIFDWNNQSDIPDGQRIFKPDVNNSIWEGKGTGSADMIAAIIEQAKLFVGVDSGPLHIAGCTNTPSIGFWKFHHPAHFYEFTKNVLHLVPGEARKFIKADDKGAIEHYFHQNYRHHYFHNQRGTATLEAIYRELDVIDKNNRPPEKQETKILSAPLILKNNQWWSIKTKL